MSTPHPQKLGKYVITEVLGEGAMGVVYKAFDPDIRRTVAIKTIRHQLPEHGVGVSAAARFRNEAQAAGRLTHPGIVAVYDFGQDDSVAYIAMEFVEGQTLAHYLASRVRFTDDDVPGIISQVLDALDHAHEQGVWHRDVKPANIIMARSGRLKVADFGIARIEDANLTQASVMIGTPTYMAPEQFLGTPMDRRVDVYAAGVLLYLLLTGRPPFVGTQEQLMYKVVHELPVLPGQIDGLARPRFYDAILTRALAKDPAQRYPTAAAFKEAVQRGVGQPIDATVWEQTLMGVPDRPAAPVAPPPTGSGSSGSNSGTQLPDHWDKVALQQAEASLARHVGPLASVLVRRAARECSDLQQLYGKLAEQVSNPQARTAFLEHATSITGGKTRSGAPAAGGTQAASSVAPATRPGAPPLDEALIDNAARLLAQHVGPIAKVMAKKAAGRTNDPAAFRQLLAEAVPEGPARQKLLAELARLG